MPVNPKYKSDAEEDSDNSYKESISPDTLKARIDKLEMRIKRLESLAPKRIGDRI